tara:strand:- start:1589 stop:2647 length:1059 start_codon:yes stop_codon:yes gene_type:complete
MRLKIKLLVLFFLNSNFYLFSQFKYSNEFLQIGAGARSISLSKAVVASCSNSSSVYWNPSSLVDLDNKEIELMHGSYFSGILNFDQLSYATKIEDDNALGFMILRLGIDDIKNTINLIDNQGNINYDQIELFSSADYAFFFSFAKKNAISGFDLGLNTKLIYRHIGDFANSIGFGFDFSSQKRIKEWKFAAIVRDIFSTYNSWYFSLDDIEQTFIDTDNDLPNNSTEITLPSLQAGVNKEYKINKYLSANTELDFILRFDGERNTLYSNKIISFSPMIGSEIVYSDLAYFRMGLGNVIKNQDFDYNNFYSVQPNLGVGFVFDSFKIDYALTNLTNISADLYSNIISVGYEFN